MFHGGTLGTPARVRVSRSRCRPAQPRSARRPRGDLRSRCRRPERRSPRPVSGHRPPGAGAGGTRREPRGPVGDCPRPAAPRSAPGAAPALGGGTRSSGWAAGPPQNHFLAASLHRLLLRKSFLAQLRVLPSGVTEAFLPAPPSPIGPQSSRGKEGQVPGSAPHPVPGGN